MFCTEFIIIGIQTFWELQNRQDIGSE